MQQLLAKAISYVCLMTRILAERAARGAAVRPRRLNEVLESRSNLG